MHHHRVCADNPFVGEQIAHLLGLFVRDPQHVVLGRFIGLFSFVDFRRDDGEGDPEGPAGYLSFSSIRSRGLWPFSSFT